MIDDMLKGDQSLRDSGRMALPLALKSNPYCLALSIQLEGRPRGAGWQNHPVCTRKYHFIIPVRASQDAALAHGNIPALVEIWLRGSSKKPLLLPQYLADDVGSPFIAPISIFDSTSHVLHGVLHANGFGHLVRINGLEGGSEHVTGEPPLHLLHAHHEHGLVRSCLLHGGEAAVKEAHHHWGRAAMCFGLQMSPNLIMDKACTGRLVGWRREADHGPVGPPVHHPASAHRERRGRLQQGLGLEPPWLCNC